MTPELKQAILKRCEDVDGLMGKFGPLPIITELIRIIEAQEVELSHVQCQCTFMEREKGHLVNCWNTPVRSCLKATTAALKKLAGMDSLSKFVNAVDGKKARNRENT